MQQGLGRRQGIRRASVVTGAALLLGLTAPALSQAEGVTAAVQHVRSVVGTDLGVMRPVSVSYSSREGALLLAQPGRRSTRLSRFDLSDGRARRAQRLPVLPRGSVLTFDARRQRLLAVGTRRLVAVTARRGARPAVRRISLRRLRLKSVAGAALDSRGRTLHILDDRARTVVRVALRARSVGAATRISLRRLDPQRLRGLAVGPADGLLYTLSPDRGRLLGLDAAGTLRRLADLRPLLLGSPQALAFAPSSDTTDHPSTLRLHIADRGIAARRGRVVETRITTLAEAERLAPTQVKGTLVRLTETRDYSPSSPDPSGIAYMPDRDRLAISDSEVEEMTLYKGVNLYAGVRGGSGVGTGTTTAYSKEPTGLGYNPADRSLFVSDDDADRLTTVKPGPDGVHGTRDDVWSRFSLSALGIGDAEGAEYDTGTGRLWLCDGRSTEVYAIAPGNGVFGDSDDKVTNFDIGQFGARDCEGMGVDVQRNTVLALDPATRKMYELSRAGVLVRTIDLAGIPVTGKALAGVTMAPTSDPNDSASAMNYWIVDRLVDNNQDPAENDGKLYEVAVPSADALPSVSLTEPADGATVSGPVTLRATASDDVGVKAVQFLVDDTVIATDTDGSDGWSVTWDSANVADGPHALKATAQDTAGQTTSSTRAVTVENAPPDTTAPRAAIDAPAAGSTVSGTIAVAVTATDDVGVESVRVQVGDTVVGTDTTGADGWSVAWNTATVPNGTSSLTAVAADAAGNVAVSAPVEVTVSNAKVTVVVSVPVATGLDDGDETVSDGAVRRTNGDLEFGTEQTGLVTVVGMRFAGVQVPRGAVVESARIQLTADETGKTATDITIHGEAADNSAPLAGTAKNITSRVKTAASVAWSPPQWLTFGAAGPGERTPDLKSIVQEIVNRPGWAAAQALTIVAGGTGRRTAESFEGGAPPVLRIEYVS